MTDTDTGREQLPTASTITDDELDQLRERLRKAERAADLLAADHRQAEDSAAPPRDELWSLLDWTFWGSGMGDVFREPLADTMTAAITAEQRDTSLRLIEAWHASGRQPLGRRRYEELSAELAEARAQVAAYENAVNAAHALADHWAQLRSHGSAAYELRAVLPPRPAADIVPLQHTGGEPGYCPACQAIPGGPAFPHCPGPGGEQP